VSGPAPPQTYYEILGIGEDASPDEISAARRGMIKAVHPDLAADEADRLEREQLARAVNDMCDTLLDPIRRYDYDVSLARARRWPDGVPDAGAAIRARPRTAQRAPGGPPEPSPFEMDEEELQAWEAAHAHDDEPAPDAGNPLVRWIPVLARLEHWLTWRISILAVLMFGLSVYLYNAAGSPLLDKIGLHFGRFGSLGVVLLITVGLVALCLGLVAVARVVRQRIRRRDG
jgi:hypothetical protein